MQGRSNRDRTVGHRGKGEKNDLCVPGLSPREGSGRAGGHKHLESLEPTGGLEPPTC